MSFQDDYEYGKQQANEWFSIAIMFWRGLKWLMWHWMGLWLTILWLVFGVITCATIVGFRHGLYIIKNCSWLTLVNSDEQWKTVREKNY